MYKKHSCSSELSKYINNCQDLCMRLCCVAFASLSTNRRFILLSPVHFETFPSRNTHYFIPTEIEKQTLQLFFQLHRQESKMAPVIPSSTLHGAMNGTHPHCDHLATAAEAVASVSSSAQATTAPDNGTAFVSVLGYVSLGLLLLVILAMAIRWSCVYFQHKRGPPTVPLPTVTLPAGLPAGLPISLLRGMTEAEGRNSLGSSVRSDIDTNVNVAVGGRQGDMAETSISPVQTKAAPKKPVKKSVSFTSEDLERRENRFVEQACQY
jgi:hypothetical protein